MQKTEHHLPADSSSSRHFPTLSLCELPGVIYSVTVSEAFSKSSYTTYLLAECPLAGTWPSVFWWHLPYGCCMQGPKPESQEWVSRLGFGLMPPIWELEHTFWNCLNLWTPVPTVPAGWAKEHRCLVISWASQYCHQDKVNSYHSHLICPLQYKFLGNRNYVFVESQCGSYFQMMLKY